MNGNHSAPLAGVMVLDLTIALAGPYGTRILADLGADVIKVDTRVERNRGDGTQQLGARLQGMYPNARPPAEAWNAAGPVGQLNRNKRSIAIDLDSAEGRDVFLSLVPKADCIVENFTPRVMAGFGFSFDALAKVNPRLVYVAMPGFGTSGPYANYPAFAPTTEAAGGLSAGLGYPDGTPVINSMAMGDFIGGLYAVGGLLAALWHARRTGEGTFVDLSQAEGVATFVGEQWVSSDGTFATVDVLGNRVPGAAPSGCYPALGFDEWVAITVESDEQWRALCRTAGRADWMEDARFATTPDRRRYQDDLDRLISTWTTALPKHVIARALQDAGVPAGAVQLAPDLLADTQLAALDFFVTIDDPLVGTLPYEGQPIHFAAAGPRPARRSARLGEDTTAVLQRLGGYSAEEVAQLRDARIIA
jgi:crotonobetainyl-CoA:carnitine CoA-transferase CaiB-like acyl-CoA transferase